jgi:ABC-type polysaccharide/polyol phosphate export permease
MQFLNQLYALSRRNVILRYKHSIIGFLWGFIKPFLYLLIFIVIFSSQFTSTDHYILYATSGILFWFFFSNIVSQGIQSIISSGGLIKSYKLNAHLFPLAEVVSELFNLVLALIVFYSIMPWFGLQYSIHLLWVLPSLVLFSIFAYSICLVLAACNVYFRDVGILWNTIQPAIFYLTPIAYTEELIPSRFAFVIHLNPIYYYIKLFRYPIYLHQSPDMNIVFTCTIVAFISLVVSSLIFNRLKNQFITAI